MWFGGTTPTRFRPKIARLSVIVCGENDKLAQFFRFGENPHHSREEVLRVARQVGLPRHLGENLIRAVEERTCFKLAIDIHGLIK